MDFSRGIQGFFHGEAKNGEILIYPYEARKTTFFSKNLIGICQILKLRGKVPCSSFRRPWWWADFSPCTLFRSPGLLAESTPTIFQCVYPSVSTQHARHREVLFQAHGPLSLLPHRPQSHCPSGRLWKVILLP